ncbi:MAG TPA: segregation and condensation protein A [Gallionellaceae bacterium]
MNVENLSKEQRILRVLRKVLANIVKDATPAPGQPHPLTEATVHDIRDLFALISEREAELAAEAGVNQEKPVYADQPRKANVVKLHKPKKAEQE